MIGYTPQSAAARKTLFKQWKVLALALIGCGLVVFLFMHFILFFGDFLLLFFLSLLF